MKNLRKQFRRTKPFFRGAEKILAVGCGWVGWTFVWASICVWFLAPGAWMLLGLPGLICSVDTFYEWAKMKKAIGAFNEEEDEDAED